MKFLIDIVVLKLCFVVVLSQNIFQSATQELHPSTKENRNNYSNSLEKVSKFETTHKIIKNFVCPDQIQRIPFLSLPCENDGECSIFGRQMVCCLKRCIKGITPVRPEINPTIDRSIDVTTKPVSTTTTTTSTTTSTTTATTTTTSITPTISVQTTSERQLQRVDNLACPGKNVRIPFFSLPCETKSDCLVFGRKMVCCSGRCIDGIPAQKEEETQLIAKAKQATERIDKSNDLPTKVDIQKIPRANQSLSLACPEGVRVPFFSLLCTTDTDCSALGSKMKCCKNRCINGVFSHKDEIDQHVTKEKQIITVQNNIGERHNVPRVNENITNIKVIKTKETAIHLVCPEGVRIPFFAYPCVANNDCSALGKEMVCCSNRCIKGVSSRKREIIDSESKEKQLITQNDIKEKSSAPIANPNLTDVKVIQTNNTTDHLVCPEGVRIPFFSLPCVTNSDCSASGKEMVCCSDRCIKGVLPRKPEIVHSPSWFGLVERNCPVDAIVEILEIKECETDADCRPRICCPDKYHNNSNKNYCRTPQPSLNRFPLANRATEPLRVFASYIQCTPPPPPIFDLFPKSCNNALDCFPNLCCQEGDKKYCRPPKRSVLQLIAGVGQRFVPPDAAKRLIERLN